MDGAKPSKILGKLMGRQNGFQNNEIKCD